MPAVVRMTDLTAAPLYFLLTILENLPSTAPAPKLQTTAFIL